VTQTASPTTKERICKLLDELPLESLTVVDRYVAFVHKQAQQGNPVVMSPDGNSAPFRYPTVAVPALVLDKLVGLAPPVGGDALADSEALYDLVPSFSAIIPARLYPDHPA
jgi:hypothetical protein